MHNFEVDLSQAESFLKSFDEALEVTFQIFHDSIKGGGGAQHFKAALDDPRCQKHLTEANQRGCGIYFAINEMDGQGRSNANVTHIRALCLDLDGSPLEPVMNCPVEPHYIIQSSPGRYHCYWLITPIAIADLGGTTAAAGQYTIWQKSLARKFNGDESVTDLARVFRLPGFYHVKGEPFLSHVVQSELSQPYDIRDLIFKLGLIEVTEKISAEVKAPLAPASEALQTKIKTGDRHRTLLQYASRWAHVNRLSMEERWILLQGLNQKACEHPISEYDLSRINTQAQKYADHEMQQMSTVDTSELLKKGQVVAEDKKNLLPLYLLQPPGLVGDMMRFILQSSVKAQPEHALAASLVACGAVMGRKVRSMTNLRTNLYAITLMESGAGKDRPRQAIKQVFHAIGNEKRALVEAVTSGSALATALEECPSQVFLLDEFGDMMEKINHKSAGSWEKDILTMLLRLSTSSHTTFNATTYSDRKMNKTILQPNACMLGTGTEETFYASITRKEITSGLMNRVLMLRSTNPNPTPNFDVTNFDPPEALLNQFRLWENIPYRAGGNLADVEQSSVAPPEPRIVSFDEHAHDVFKDMDADCRARHGELRREGYAALFTRSYEMSVKIAMILACGQNIECPIISCSDATYACDLVLATTNQTLHDCRTKIADHRLEKQHKDALTLIRDAMPNGITLKDFGQRAKKFGLDRRGREELLLELESWGLIISEVVQGSGRATTVYKYLGGL